MVIKKILAAWLRTFFKSTHGNVAMMFALSLNPIMIGAGVGLDFARAMLVRQQMGEALDAAALAVGSTTGLSQSDAQALAQKYFNSNYTVSATDYGTPTVAIPATGYNSKGSVTITASDTMPTVLVKLIGITTIPITTSSNVVWGQTKLWVALVLDNSGSMIFGDASGSKMTALKNASNQLLTILQNAASNPGDVQVSVVPFVGSVSVGTTNVGASWIDWRNWECPPQTTNGDCDPSQTQKFNDAVLDGHPLNTFGPGDKCPFDGSKGYVCAPSPINQNCVNNGTCITTIPSSGTYTGYICPSEHAVTAQDGLGYHFYNGCWVVTGAGSIAVTGTGSSTNCNDYASGHCACGTSTNNYMGVPTGIYLCVAFVWNTTWVPNNHSTWTGCVMDRTQNYDIASTTPSSTLGTKFPAENTELGCSATITTLGYNWTNLSAQVNAMVASGATNQAIGIAHGWQTLTPGDPYGAPSVPANTTRYIIVLSDGVNTLHRLWGDGSTENSTADANIDAREKATCDAAKAEGIVIYSIFVNIGGGGNSAPLQYCASDATKYYALTTTNSVVTTFQQIAQQITNLRVVK